MSDRDFKSRFSFVLCLVERSNNSAARDEKFELTLFFFFLFPSRTKRPRNLYRFYPGNIVYPDIRATWSQARFMDVQGEQDFEQMYQDGLVR